MQLVKNDFSNDFSLYKQRFISSEKSKRPHLKRIVNSCVNNFVSQNGPRGMLCRD